MTEENFRKSRSSDWDRFAQMLSDMKHRKQKPSLDFPSLYRRVCQDLNHSKTAEYSAPLQENLTQLIWEGHQILYHKKQKTDHGLFRMFFLKFPRCVRAHGKAILGAHIFFYGLALLIFFYGLTGSAQLGLFLPDQTKVALAQMYDPHSANFLHPREVTDSADMFGFYIFNNIGIGLRTFAGGALAGIGSLFFLTYNAIFFGAATSWIVQLNFQLTFIPFVIAHSAFELTAIILFAVAGGQIGWALIAPGREIRTRALFLKTKENLPLVYGAFCFLIVAAGIEAFWSSQLFSIPVKIGAGMGTWLLVILFFLFGGRGEKSP